MIAIFGASGNTGGTAAASLLKAGKKVRVVGRSKEKLARLIEAGAESALGDIENPSFIKSALAGADSAYVLIPPNMVTDDFRAYQRRVVDSFVGAIEATGVRHVVLLSSAGAHHREGTGPIVALHAFEERLAKVASLNALFLRAGFFMENVLMSLALIKGQGIYPGPMPAEVAVPMIASADIGNYAASRLARLDFSGKSVMHIVGPRPVSQTDLVSILSQAVDKPIRYQQVSLDDVEKGLVHAGMKSVTVALFMEMYRGAGQGLVAPEAGGPIVQGSTTFETFAKQVFAPAYRA